MSDWLLWVRVRALHVGFDECLLLPDGVQRRRESTKARVPRKSRTLGIRAPRRICLGDRHWAIAREAQSYDRNLCGIMRALALFIHFHQEHTYERT